MILIQLYVYLIINARIQLTSRNIQKQLRKIVFLFFINNLYLDNYFISINKSYLDILLYQNKNNNVNAKIVLFVSEYHIDKKQKLLIENTGNIKDINTNKEIALKTKETLFNILQQVI